MIAGLVELAGRSGVRAVRGQGSDRRIHPRERATPLPSARTADAIGAALVAALAAWMAIGSGRGAGDPSSVLWLLVATAGIFAAGRWLAEREPLAVHRLVALGVAGAVLLTLPGISSSGGAPLGYANANATLAGLGLIAAIGVAVAEPARRLRSAWAAVAAGLAVAVIAAGSVAGALCLLAGLALLAASTLIRRPSTVVLGGAISVVATIASTAAISKGSDLAGLAERAALRGDLWSAAADLASAHPMQGIGMGQFEVLTPISTDPDLRWAHHEYLQVAAEAGGVGLILLLSLLGWAYARVGLAGTLAPQRAALGAAALTLVALHATVDYVLHHAAVVLTLALLVGASTARTPRRPIPAARRA